MDDAQVNIKAGLESVVMKVQEESREELDLAKAMDDRETIFRMEAKLEALETSMQIFEQTIGADSLDAFKAAFDERMALRKTGLEQAIVRARAEQNSQELIYQQIHLSVSLGPVEGTVDALYKRYKEETCQA
ncbi:MAG: hypothetical protein KC422_16035 [Trueperaceae bacterium]|nr:hypothetical protein [Trueperaceae bacterium]